MKRSIKILFILPVLLFILYSSSCDKIDNPIKPSYGDLDTSLYPGPGFYVFPSFDENYPSIVENILIEDYTGHTCGNCPAAAVIAHDLKEANPGRVFVSSVHASPGSTFQDVNVEGEDEDWPKYSHEFRTEAGEDYVSDIGGFIGNPEGMINRKLNDAEENWKFSPFWAAAVEEIINSSDPLLMNLQVKTNYYTESRGLFVHVQSESIESLEGRYNLVVFLNQDEFIAWQKDYTLVDQDIEDYHHKDVFLGTLNGSYGVQLFDGMSESGEIFENHFSVEIPESIDVLGSNAGDDTGLNVVAYLMERDSYEIVQVVDLDIKITY